MATKLSEATMKELSLVMAEWGAPRNEEAIVLATKGEETPDTRTLGQDIREGCLKTLKALGLIKGEKAGARHSAADKGHIDAINAAHEKMGKSLSKMQKLHDAVAAHIKALSNQGDPSNAADPQADEDREDTPQKASEGKYGDVAYADTANKKYPIDTEEHARAAWSYINQEKNADKYSSSELSEIKAKIKAACEKFGIEIDDSKAAPTGEIDLTQDQIDAIVAKATESAVAAVKAEMQGQVDAANAATVAVKEAADAAKSAAAEATAKAESDALAAKAAQIAAETLTNQAARQPSAGTAGDPEAKKAHSQKLLDSVKAANSGSGSMPSAMGR
jgi:hypothetical protein